MANKKYDIICAGEILADLIGGSYGGGIDQVDQFELFAGGSPANLACNLGYLGNKVALVASVGHDDIGKMLLKNLKASGVSKEFVAVREMPSTLILVTRSKATASFEAYRGADTQMSMGQVDLKKIAKAKLFHTSCFGLSKEPARSTILACAEAVAGNKGQLSIDLNYAQKIWPKRKKALRWITEYLRMEPLVKCSEVDYERIFEKPMKNPQKALDEFLGMGAKQVCLTLGDKGCWVADAENESFLPSRKLKVVDTTGAGDAFWSGYLTGWLKGRNIVDCAKAGRAMAEKKLLKIGQIHDKVDFEKLLKG